MRHVCCTHLSFRPCRAEVDVGREKESLESPVSRLPNSIVGLLVATMSTMLRRNGTAPRERLFGCIVGQGEQMRINKSPDDRYFHGNALLRFRFLVTLQPSSSVPSDDPRCFGKQRRIDTEILEKRSISPTQDLMQAALY